jgi:Orsellinic acid/F9775 biosynthesis cluster protein D
MEPFKVLLSYELLVCTVCKYCVLLNEVPRHLQDHHRQFTPAERHAIFEAVYIPTLYEDQRALRAFKIPTEPIPPIAELDGPFPDGFRCHQCPFIARAVCYWFFLLSYEN